ncbi:MAG: sulfatase-like hydrolase/transferase [Opitutaceae bacterium]|nr:sulfatase-like hydrolase/transferase [Opitutaceae bacterium]
MMKTTQRMLFMLMLLASASLLAARKPNIVIIFTDDQQYDSYGANGRSNIQTPALDRLAERGVRFTNAHAALSLCSPSRAAVITGRYGSANGVQRLNAQLREGEVSFAQDLKRSGYTTLFSGKWHLKNTPNDLGFDRACSFRGNGTYYGRKVNDEGRELNAEEHVDLYCAKKSVEMIEDAAEEDEPFVLFHCTQLPHMDNKHTWPAAKKFNDLYAAKDMPLPANWNDSLEGKPDYLKVVRNRTQAQLYGYDKPENIRKHVKDYYAVVSEMDSFLKRIFKSLKENGVDDNTYVIYMSDNGWMLGDHGFTSKVLPFTASTRVPLVIAGPGIKQGICDTPALNLDLTATLYDIANVEPTASLHGRSLLPLVNGEDSNRTIIYECLGGFGGSEPVLAAINSRWLYIQTLSVDDHTEITFEELYDKDKDPAEMSNLMTSKQHRAVLKSLKAEIVQHRTDVLKR